MAITAASIADEIFRELGEPSDTNIPSISFWLTSNLGKLNNLIGADYQYIDSEITPEINEQVKAIFKLLYIIYYYNRQVNLNLGAAAYVSVIEIKEGNRTVRRANKNDVAKGYRALVADYNDELLGQLLNYKMGLAAPTSLIVDNPILTELSSTVDSTRNYRDHNSF